MDTKDTKPNQNVPDKPTISFTDAIDMTTKRVTTMHEKLVAFTNSVNDNESIEEQTKKFIELHRNYKTLRRLCLLINKSSSMAEEQDKLLNDLQRRLDLKKGLLERLNEIPKKLKQVNPGESVVVPERKTYTIEVEDIPSIEKNEELVLGTDQEEKKGKIIQKLLEIKKNEENNEGNKNIQDVQGPSSSSNLRDLLSSNSK
uniref:Mediator complex subunit 9 n=1 Tax=Strongyloides papillosus TaxID=174720 RepID=A0A0N5BDW0_STREA